MAAVLIRPEARQFFCWRWYRWQPWRRLKHCCNAGCRRMEVPPRLGWRAAYERGIMVRWGVV
jgi:hypothetical protein